jgi:hypothetical protein
MTAAYLLDLTVPLSIPKVVILPLGLEITKVPKVEALVPKIILYSAGRFPLYVSPVCALFSFVIVLRLLIP